MVEKYDSKESALETGLEYLGYGDPALIKKAMAELPEPVKIQIGWPDIWKRKTVDTYKVRTLSSEHDIQIGVGQYRDGFDLWLIVPEKRIYTRV